MEALLHYAWQHRLYDAPSMVTTTGAGVEVLTPGTANRDAGPDFTGAMLRIGDVTWAGNVELHLKASQWQQHGHHTDPAYNNTILHVVCQADAEAVTADGKVLPTLVLPIPREVRDNYVTLLRTADYPRCHTIVRTISPLKRNAWMNALLVERMQQRAAQVQLRADQCGGDWERAFFITLARNFGFGKNGDTFEQWARQMPLSAAAHHRDDMMQMEALFLGTAGLLAVDALPRASRDAGVADEYFGRLQREYAYLSHKYAALMPPPFDGSQWKFLRLRPQMFPHIKLVQLATLYHNRRATLMRVIDIVQSGSADDVLRRLADELCVPAPDYWQHHYLFGVESAHSLKRLSPSSLRLITINTVVPTLFAYAAHAHRPALEQQALALLEQLPAEQNYIMRQWQDCGLTVSSAADSQALLHLKRTRCDTYDCLHCRFGYEYLKKEVKS